MSYDYNSWEPVNISKEELDDRQHHLLSESKTFCMLPWIHLHAYPTGAAYPCCMSEMSESIGSVKDSTIVELINNDDMKQLRLNMLEGKKSKACTRCYEQEENGFMGGRQSSNKHHGHKIHKIADTEADGHLNNFEMSYWDIRFSNLCNLSCRTCGYIFSSSWHKDDKAMHGDEWAKRNPALLIAGRSKTDMFNQLMEHIDYVEQIYFAGGEPLTMDEHYKILDELEKRKMFHVRLIYNTNFTQIKLKDREVFDYWKKFDSVSVGASLDAMGARAEYMRKGTKWDVVEENRRKMLEICPDVDFYVSATLSIMNALHITDFHKDWVEKGFIKAQDFNVNILQDPPEFRIDIAPPAYKDRIRELYQKHLKWLAGKDNLNRVTSGFHGAINFMDATDNTYLIPAFWEKINKLDEVRNETYLDSIIEIHDVK